MKSKLPDRDEMLRRLVALDNNSHLVQKFYPKLLKDAGTEKFPLGVVMLLILAIADYTKGMPIQMQGIMEMKVPEIIKCMSPNEEFSGETLAAWEASFKKH